VGTVRLRVVTRSRPLGHAAAAHSSARAPPSAIGRQPAAVANRLRAMSSPLWPTKLGRNRLGALLAYKNPLPFLAHARAAQPSATVRH
jgi:hypothetical protein